MGDIAASEPGPAELWVTVDEHPDGIDDAWLIIYPDKPDQWWNLPASYHNGAAGFTFADGHAQVHKWLEDSTVIRVRQLFIWDVGGWPPTPNSRDVKWMIEHSTTPVAGRLPRTGFSSG
jgi:prepilin-type processing-associated H-X9-DG protein